MRIRLRAPGHAGSLLAELERCRRSGRYCDVFLRVGRRTFAAHRAVLACAATYFGNLFGGAAAAPRDAVSLDFVSPADFEKVLSFVYTGETLADVADVGVLYELAERLGASELARACRATFPDLPGELAAASSSSVSSSTASAVGAADDDDDDRGDERDAAAATAGRLSPAGTASADLKIEDIRSLVGYGQILAESAGLRLWSREAAAAAGPELQTEKEQTGEEAVPGDSAEPDGAARHTQEGRRGQLAGDIIQLSDDENVAVEDQDQDEHEDEDEDDLVCVENASQSGGQVAAAAAPRRPAEGREPGRRHLCGAGASRLAGVRLFSCDMCQLDFCSQRKLLRHQRRSGSARYLAAPPRGCGPRCAVCARDLGEDFKAVREHVLSHVCPRRLSCGVCRLPQRSLCSLLWHAALAHLLLPIFACPRCGRCFAHRPLLDAHAAAHGEERGDIRAVTVGGGNLSGSEELDGSAPPPSFALLTFGGGGEAGKRKARRPSPPSSPRGLAALGLAAAGPGPPPTCFPADGGGARPPRGKWYRCRYCGKRFAHSGEFTYHLRIHTGEKPYQCKVCLRFFRGRSTIICHLKTHAGALMYRCTVCGLYRSTLKTMALHVELHKDRLPPDFNMEHTFMYNDRSKEAPPLADA